MAAVGDQAKQGQVDEVNGCMGVLGLNIDGCQGRNSDAGKVIVIDRDIRADLIAEFFN
jgi:hypothetical protein